MARVITKKSTVPGKVPLAEDLDIGELAVNTADAKLYTKHNDGSVKQLGGDAASGFFRTEPITATASGQTAFTVPGGYTPGAIFVSLNGASLPPADFTATNGTTVVLASGGGIVDGSVLLVHVLSAFEVADALPLNGTAKDSERFAGLLPPPADGKPYALKNGAWADSREGQLGWGQTWQDVAASRTPDTTYTNTSGRPIQVKVTGATTSAGTGGYAVTLELYVGETKVESLQGFGSNQNYKYAVTAIIPPGATYRCWLGVGSIAAWKELR